MNSKRDSIESLRNKLRERNADSNYSNKFLYQTLLEQAKWLIRREISAGRIYGNAAFFQTLLCQDVIETSLIDPCCPIKTNCKIYRTKEKIPDFWMDESGPIIKSVSSVDNSVSFQMTTVTNWMDIDMDPYQKKSKEMYTFFSDGYLWFPKHNPHKINIIGFWTDDISSKNGCGKEEDCIRFLDTKFLVPHWVEAEMMAKAVELLAGVSKRLPEDEQIDKNTTRKN